VQSAKEEHSYFNMLLSLPGSSVCLRDLVIRGESASSKRFSQNLALVMRLLSPTLGSLVLEDVGETAQDHTRIILDCSSKVCKTLQTLHLQSPDDDAEPKVTAAVFSHIPLFTSLTSLIVEPIKFSPELFRTIAKLPLLEQLTCYSINVKDLHSQHGEPPQLAFPEAGLDGYTNLKRLDTYGTLSDTYALLNSIPTGNLEEIDLQNNYTAVEEIGFIPDRFLAPKMISMRIASNYGNDDIGPNISSSWRRFTSLRFIVLYTYGYLPNIKDEQLLDGLKECFALEELEICVTASTYFTDVDEHRITIGCIEPLLRSFPNLRRIAGCFDLGFPLADMPAFQHPAFQSLDLGTSYFFTPQDENQNWIPMTVSYLASFFQGSISVKLSGDVCMARQVSNEERGIIKKRREKDKEFFDDFVIGLNTFKSRIAPQVV
jgi:hypothetical protein